MPSSKKNISGARQTKKNLRHGRKLSSKTNIKSPVSKLDAFQGTPPRTKYNIRSNMKILGKRTMGRIGPGNLNNNRKFAKGKYNNIAKSSNAFFPFAKSREGSHPQKGYSPHSNPSFPMPNYNSKALGQENIQSRGVNPVTTRNFTYDNMDTYDLVYGTGTSHWSQAMHYTTAGYQYFNIYQDGALTTNMDRPCIYGGYNPDATFECWHKLETHTTGAVIEPTDQSTTMVADFHATLCEIAPEVYCNPHCNCSLKECDPDNCGGFCGICSEGYCRHEASNTGMMLDKRICDVDGFQGNWGGCLCMTSDQSILDSYNIVAENLTTNGFYNSGHCYNLNGEQIGTSGFLIGASHYNSSSGFTPKKTACGMLYGTMYVDTGGGSGCERMQKQWPGTDAWEDPNTPATKYFQMVMVCIHFLMVVGNGK